MTDWCDDYLACRLCNLYLRLTNRAFYRTYRQAECRDLFHAAGYGDVRIDRYKISWLWGLMTATVKTAGAPSASTMTSVVCGTTNALSPSGRNRAHRRQRSARSRRGRRRSGCPCRA
jgi:hypothetical protein